MPNLTKMKKLFFLKALYINSFRKHGKHEKNRIYNSIPLTSTTRKVLYHKRYRAFLLLQKVGLAFNLAFTAQKWPLTSSLMNICIRSPERFFISSVT